MPLSHTQKFLLAVGVQIGILLIVLAAKLIVVSTGTPIFLKLQPVDPRDPLRGDYMQLSYEISRIEAYEYPGQEFINIRTGDTVYVPLTRSGKFSYVSRDFFKEGPILRSIPAKQCDDVMEYGRCFSDEMIFLKGRVMSVHRVAEPRQNNRINNNPKNSPEIVQVSYLISFPDIERYFIPEGSGQNLRIDGQNDYARVIVDEEGNAVLKDLYLDDKRWP